jgi:hypothetical protein
MELDERRELLEGIVTTVSDYRCGEIAPVDQNHVISWLAQFDERDHDVILRETAHLLKKSYISKKSRESFIRKLASNGDLVGVRAKQFWSEVGFLRLQKTSQSQADMLDLLGDVLGDQFGLSAESQESASSTYIYLDDACFSGRCT